MTGVVILTVLCPNSGTESGFYLDSCFLPGDRLFLIVLNNAVRINMFMKKMLG